MKLLAVSSATLALSSTVGAVDHAALKSYIVNNNYNNVQSDDININNENSNSKSHLNTINKLSNLHRNLQAKSNVQLHLEDQEEEEKSSLTCDVQFTECLSHDKCTSCFKSLTENQIDWSIVAPETPCDSVLNVIMNNMGYCQDLRGDSPERNVFCKTVDACRIWKADDKEGKDDDQPEKDDIIDCTSLQSCEWEGMKKNYIGDGICHEFIGGCYNSAICNYDGGDCCADTCKNTTDLATCGSDGYFCRDPNSAKCENCTATNDDEPGPNPITAANCTIEQTPFKLIQYDSFGDGWDLTEMAIIDRSDQSQHPIYSGRLEDGFEGTKYICLSKNPTCYQVKLDGGFWGNEVSWSIKPMKNGAPDIASGGAPMDCEFAIAGGHCDNTCTGRANVDPKDDEKYHTYHKMANCISEKCSMQLGMCQGDLVCSSCITADITPAFCLASDIFNAVGFCTNCNCVEGIDAADKEVYCQKKSREKHENEDGDDDVATQDNNENSRVRSCSFSQFTEGSEAVIDYSVCSGVGTLTALLTNFDPDNFGMLDAFESCASDYTASKYGKSALDCLRILEKAIDHPGQGIDPSRKDVPVEAISALAKDLLNDGENFCECTSKASEAAPVCEDFIHFKTLLYESLDGCKSLDAIDCDAWAEFYTPCKANMMDKFKGKLDFRRKGQCEYARNRCGNVGPFPSFRRLDCGDEINAEAWDFYLQYERNCLRDGPAPAPVPAPAAKPVPKSPVPAPTVPYKPKPYTPKASPSDSASGGDSSSGGGSPWDIPNPSPPKKYIPPEQRNKSKLGTFFKWVFIILLLGAAFWYYKTRYGGGFDYNQFRRTRNYGANTEGMYDSLTMSNAEMSFVPPTLPPPPSSYEMNPSNGNMGSSYVGGVA